MRSAVSLVGLFAGLAAATCYRLDSKPYELIRADDGGWQPCDPDAKVSSCCSSKDYCLGNGLCLDAASNNLFSIQGCTDSSWSSPCISSQVCKDNLKDEYSFVWACSQKTELDFNYCCGETAACCGNTSSLISIPVTTKIFRPGAAASTTSNPSGTSTNPATSQSTTPSTASSDDSKTLIIALGVGLGVGIPLIAALVFFGWQLRKSKMENQRPMSLATSPYQPSVAMFSPKAPISTPPPHQYQYQPIPGPGQHVYPQGSPGLGPHTYPHGSPELDSHEAPQQPSELQ